MSTDDINPLESPSLETRGDPLPQVSGGSSSAPWTGRRMYASGHPGAGADETETGSDLGVAETAVWSAFLTRIIKAKQPQ